ncbi:MAG: RidA family protein [Alphaproteobacteria bacterium]|nr:RidA family protein [Alphaproteobacteria bacterium]
MTRRLISSGSKFETEFGYSRAVVDGEWVFVSGTTGFDYARMEISPAVDAQTAQCFANIEAALKQAGASLADIVRVVIYVRSIEDFQIAAPVIGETLRGIRPANTTVLAGFVDPRIRIEIEATAKRRSA